MLQYKGANWGVKKLQHTRTESSNPHKRQLGHKLHSQIPIFVLANIRHILEKKLTVPHLPSARGAVAD